MVYYVIWYIFREKKYNYYFNIVEISVLLFKSVFFSFYIFKYLAFIIVMHTMFGDSWVITFFFFFFYYGVFLFSANCVFKTNVTSRIPLKIDCFWHILCSYFCFKSPTLWRDKTICVWRFILKRFGIISLKINYHFIFSVRSNGVRLMLIVSSMNHKKKKNINKIIFKNEI